MKGRKDSNNFRIFEEAGPFLTYILEGQNPPPPPAPMLATLKGFGSPSNVPFCLKMSENHAEIAGNQV